MSVVLVLVFGAGVFVVYDALTSPPSPPGDRMSRMSARAHGMLARAGLPDARPSQLAGACTGAGVLAALVTAVVVGSPTVALVALCAGAYVPLATLRSRARARRRALRQCWPEAVELLAGAVRAGDTLPAAVAAVAERGPEPLRPAFRSLATDHRVSGDLLGALTRVTDAMSDPTADRVFATLAIAHRVGGRELGRVLRTLAAFLREDLATRREIESRQSWTLVAARVAAASPWLVLLLVATRAASIHAFDTVGGAIVLLTGAVATILGYRLMVALGRLPDEPRVLQATPR